MSGTKQPQTDRPCNFKVACRKLPGSAGRLLPGGSGLAGRAAVESHVKELRHKDNKQEQKKINYFDLISVHALSRPDYI